jgi:hypothetical protein
MRRRAHVRDARISTTAWSLNGPAPQTGNTTRSCALELQCGARIVLGPLTSPHWPVLTRPQLAGFQMSTEARAIERLPVRDGEGTKCRRDSALSVHRFGCGSHAGRRYARRRANGSWIVHLEHARRVCGGREGEAAAKIYAAAALEVCGVAA